MSSAKAKLSSKLAAEYKDVQTLPPALAARQAGPAGPKRSANDVPTGAASSVKLIAGAEGVKS